MKVDPHTVAKSPLIVSPVDGRVEARSEEAVLLSTDLIRHPEARAAPHELLDDGAACRVRRGQKCRVSPCPINERKHYESGRYEQTYCGADDPDRRLLCVTPGEDHAGADNRSKESDATKRDPNKGVERGRRWGDSLVPDERHNSQSSARYSGPA